jgi:hypothetical protein
MGAADCGGRPLVLLRARFVELPRSATAAGRYPMNNIVASPILREAYVCPVGDALQRDAVYVLALICFFFGGHAFGLGSVYPH